MGATIGLGRAQVSRLREGVPWVVLCVNTDRPLFWLLARSHIGSMADLRGRTVAVHSPTTGPGCWARILLRRHGLDPDRDVVCVERAPGDYSHDLRQLNDGSIDAAVIGSTLSPQATAAELGLHVLSFVGEELRIPTTGIAVDPTHTPLDSVAVRGLVRANVRALRTVLDDASIAIRNIRGLIPRLDPEEADCFYRQYVKPFFRADGLYESAAARKPLLQLAKELGATEIPSEQELYRTELTADWCADL
jgi:NitT/TauT family transport system substrate-binding protein